MVKKVRNTECVNKKKDNLQKSRNTKNVLKNTKWIRKQRISNEKYEMAKKG